MGVKDFIVVFVFHTEKALDDFRDSGWDFSGLALQATLQGTKFWADDDLN